MSFSPNIPNISDPTLQSFQQIRANFQAINNSFADNHIGLNQDTSIAGMHRVLTLRPQASDPTTSATQVALYNKLVSGNPAIFYRPNNSQTPIQMTYNPIQTGLQSLNPDVYYLKQYSYIAGPFIIYGGLLTGVVDNTAVTLTPGSNLLYVGLIAQGNANFIGQATPTNLSGTSFNIRIQGALGPANIYYFGIGQ